MSYTNMSYTKKGSVIAGILSAVILAGCDVRDIEDDVVNSSASGSGTDGTVNIDTDPSAAVLGSDTSAIAGFWEPSFGSANQLYVVISEVGDWSYIREDSEDNCYNVESLSIRHIQNDEYSLDDDGVIEFLNLVVSETGALQVASIPAAGSAVYLPVVNIMPQDLQLCDN